MMVTAKRRATLGFQLTAQRGLMSPAEQIEWSEAGHLPPTGLRSFKRPTGASGTQEKRPTYEVSA